MNEENKNTMLNGNDDSNLIKNKEEILSQIAQIDDHESKILNNDQSSVETEDEEKAEREETKEEMSYRSYNEEQIPPKHASRESYYEERTSSPSHNHSFENNTGSLAKDNSMSPLERRLVENPEVSKIEKPVEPKRETKTTKPVQSNNFLYKLLDSFYLGTKARIIIYIVLLLLFMISSFLYFNKAFQFNNEEIVNYDEHYNLDYRVNLKPNDVFDKPYLEKDMTYVSTLIDSVDISYEYEYNMDHETDIDFSYYVYAVLAISNSDGQTYYSKNYQITKPKVVKLDDNNKISISEKVNIDYQKYNSLATQFRASYGVSTQSSLRVFIKITKINQNENLPIKFSESSPFALEIPLSEKTVNITMNYKELNETKEIVSEANVNLMNNKSLIVAVVLLILTIITLVLFVRFVSKINTKKSKYDKYVESKLKEYDRLIVNTQTKPVLDVEHIYKVHEFGELLDVRDALQLPIMYYEIAKHQKCQFYVLQKDAVYILTIKAVDMEAKGKNE